MMEWLEKQPELMTVGQVAELFSVSDKTVRRMIRDGRLQAVAFGRSWRISKDALKTIAQNRVEPGVDAVA